MGALGKGSLWCSLCLTGPVQDYKTELRPKLAEGFDQNYAKPQLCPKIRPKPYKPEDPKTVVRTTPQTLIQVLRRPKTTGFNPPRLDCSSVSAATRMQPLRVPLRLLLMAPLKETFWKPERNPQSFEVK